MIRKILLTLCLFIGVALLAADGQSAQKYTDKIKFPPLNKQEMPKIDKINLENGLVLYLLEDHELPLVNAAVRLAAGDYLTRAEKIGLASITGEVMRTGGTESMTGDNIDEALEAIGASIEVNIGKTSGNARMNILSEYADTGLGILADILRRPIFDRDKIDLAKTSARTEISRRNDDAFGICIREFRKAVYGASSPYARQTEYGTISAITRDDLIAFHKQYVTPENVMIAVWGDFNKEDMTARIKKYFGDWPRGTGRVPALPEVKYEFKPAVYYIQKDDINQTNILLGHIGGFTGDSDYYAMTVMNDILGSPSSSRLYNNVRTKQGLAYGVGGNYNSNIAYPGFYYNYCLTKSESTVKAIRGVINEIKNMQITPPTTAEMRQGKDGYLNSFVFNFEDKGEIITRMMEYDYYELPSDFLYRVKDNIEKVTPNDVLAVAKKRLHPEALQIMVVGRGADFDEPLSVLGQVDTIDITIPTGESKSEVVVTPEALAKGKEFLALAAKACGGKEKFSKLTGVSSKGSFSLVLPQGEFTLKSNSIHIFPDKVRTVMVTPMGEILTVSNGKEAWVKQGDNVMPAPENQAKDTQEEIFRNTLLLFKNIDSPDYQVVFVGADKLNDQPVNIVQLTSADGQTSYKLALDAKTNLPAGKYYFGETMTGPGNLVEIYSDYREISGIKIPFVTKIESDGKKVVEETVTEYQINPVAPDSLFSKPQ